jgi:hypothetical protein
MHNLPRFPHKSEREHQLAVSVFLAGLPDLHRGRIVTASSDVDSWRRKPPAIERRLAAARQLREVRA